MRGTLILHIIAGGLGLLAGFVALFTAKGGELHRKSGRLFVYAMLTMALTGAIIAALQSVEASVIAGLLAAYLVTTALATVLPAPAWSRWRDLALMALALAIGTSSLALGFETLASPTRKMDGIPAPIFFMFGTVGLLAGLSDIRIIRSDALRGAARLTRHLWRMCFALWIAAMSFFLGQAQVFPKAIRIPALLLLPPLSVLLVMIYYLWRLRRRASSAEPWVPDYALGPQNPLVQTEKP